MANQEDDVRKEIESREAEFVRLINEGEIDRLVETFYTTTPVSWPPTRRWPEAGRR